MIKLFRLISNEEIIAFCTQSEDGWTMENPTLIVPTEKGIGLMPMMPYSKLQTEKTFLKNSVIAFVTEPVSELESKFKAIHIKVYVQENKIII
tara:strand:- start:856 stop:1134 length:279 start_codon:yes stop_codon:yes gene_type:complete